MNLKAEMLIEELKGMVLDLHRSAGQLDSIIQCIENEIEMEHISGNDYWKVFVEAQTNYRRDYTKYHNYVEFEKREEQLWKRLINELSTIES